MQRQLRPETIPHLVQATCHESRLTLLTTASIFRLGQYRRLADRSCIDPDSHPVQLRQFDACPLNKVRRLTRHPPEGGLFFVDSGVTVVDH